MNRYLTSADRALIARITDLAIDVTAQGQHHAAAEYSGGVNALHVRIRPASVDILPMTHHRTVYLPDDKESGLLQVNYRAELCEITTLLEDLLTKPEEPSC